MQLYEIVDGKRHKVDAIDKFFNVSDFGGSERQKNAKGFWLEVRSA